MKLTIFGATGGVGSALLAQAQDAGHEVTAAVRDPSALPGGVRSVTVDLSRPDASRLDQAVRGADAVLSAVGHRSPADAGLMAGGTAAIEAAMRRSGVRRLVVISAAPVGTVASTTRPNPPRYDPGDGFVMRHLLSPMVKRFFHDVYVDAAEMEDGLRASDLDWTAVRPPQLTNGPHTARYRTAVGRNVGRGLRISRADVADLMLRVAIDPATFRTTVGAAN